jgi:hypothetical protein
MYGVGIGNMAILGSKSEGDKKTRKKFIRNDLVLK